MIPAQEPTGIFGKLPAHGDFIHRNLATRVINVWDDWLQAFVAATQERLGEAWLEVYLTSPIWRFCLSEGVVDEHTWAGIVLPSVDRVGRYFPFSVMHKLPNSVNPLAFVGSESPWYEAVETSALRALDGQIQVDRLVEDINRARPALDSPYLRQQTPRVEAGVVVDTDFEQADTLVTMPHLLEAFVKTSFTSFSVWHTSGSERVEPCLFIAPGMPPASGSAAMLDGLWEHWEWSVPVRINR